LASGPQSSAAATWERVGPKNSALGTGSRESFSSDSTQIGLCQRQTSQVDGFGSPGRREWALLINSAHPSSEFGGRLIPREGPDLCYCDLKGRKSVAKSNRIRVHAPQGLPRRELPTAQDRSAIFLRTYAHLSPRRSAWRRRRDGPRTSVGSSGCSATANGPYIAPGNSRGRYRPTEFPTET
jgi:hypothetical protein